MLCVFVLGASGIVQFIANKGQAVLPEFFEQLRRAARNTSIEMLKPLAEIGDAQFFNYMRKWAIGQFSLWMTVTGNSLKFIVHVLFAGLIGISVIMIGMSPSKPNSDGLSGGVRTEGHQFLDCFSHLLTAQLYVAIWNTTFTLLYTFGLLPALGVELPLRETMVIATFLLSFIPALGNVLANSVMVVLCLQFPLWVLALSLTYLIVVHKVEYLINARVLSNAYKATVAELLVCILLGETMFGLPGLIVLPVVYLYSKDVLDRLKLL